MELRRLHVTDNEWDCRVKGTSTLHSQCYDRVAGQEIGPRWHQTIKFFILHHLGCGIIQNLGVHGDERWWAVLPHSGDENCVVGVADYQCISMCVNSMCFDFLVIWLTHRYAFQDVQDSHSVPLLRVPGIRLRYDSIRATTSLPQADLATFCRCQIPDHPRLEFWSQ